VTRRLAVVVALAVTVAGLGLGPATARWSRPLQLEQPAWSPSAGAQVATARGWTTPVWGAVSRSTTQFAVRARQIRPDGSLTPVRTLSEDLPATEATVTADHRGRALAVWVAGDPQSPEQVDSVYARRLDRGGLGRIRQVSRLSQNGIGESQPVVAIAPDGGAMIAWDDLRSGGVSLVQWRTLSRAGRLGRLHTSSDSSGLTPLTACPDGSFVVGSFTDEHDLVLHRVRNGRVRSRNVTHDVPPKAVSAVLGCDGSSNVHAAFVTARHLRTGAGLAARARVWTRGGRLTRTQRVSPRGQLVATLVLATDRAGASEVAWADHVAPFAYRLRARHWDSSGRLGPIHSFGRILGYYPSTTFDLPPDIGLALNGAGRGAIAWNRPVTHDRQGPFEVLAAGLAPGGAFGRTTLLGKNSLEPFVAVPAHGRALVVRTGGDSPGKVLLQAGP